MLLGFLGFYHVKASCVTWICQVTKTKPIPGCDGKQPWKSFSNLRWATSHNGGPKGITTSHGHQEVRRRVARVVWVDEKRLDDGKEPTAMHCGPVSWFVEDFFDGGFPWSFSFFFLVVGHDQGWGNGGSPNLVTTPTSWKLRGARIPSLSSYILKLSGGWLVAVDIESSMWDHVGLYFLMFPRDPPKKASESTLKNHWIVV